MEKAFLDLRKSSLFNTFIFSDILSPSSLSFDDMSSPKSIELQQPRCYPRGIINPNYPGFQHLAHTLAEHFIDHNQFEYSDSEISEDFDFDVAYRSRNLVNVNIMNDSNNNNDTFNTGYGSKKNTDLNRTENWRSSLNVSKSIGNDLGMLRESRAITNKDDEDGNVNLMLKSEPKIFCESKQLDLNDTFMEMDRFSSEDEEREVCLLSSKNVPKNFNSESNEMDFDEDDLADLSGEDDAEIRNELEMIDTSHNEFNKNTNGDTYSKYEYKRDLRKSHMYEGEHKAEEGSLADDDNSKLPTPDILIKHNNKRLQSSGITAKEKITTTDEKDYKEGEKRNSLEVSLSNEQLDYQPDLIKNIKSLNITNQSEVEGKTIHKEERLQIEADNVISSSFQQEIPSNEKNINGNDEKRFNRIQTETLVNASDESNEDLGSAQTVRMNLPLSFESTTSTIVDIIGDFGKEIEKEIGLIVSGYRNTPLEICSSEGSCEKMVQQLARPRTFSNKDAELVYDENKFMEHLKHFSKVRKRMSRTHVKIFILFTFIITSFPPSPFVQIKRMTLLLIKSTNYIIHSREKNCQCSVDEKYFYYLLNSYVRGVFN